MAKPAALKPEPNFFIRHKDKVWHVLLGGAVSFIVATIVNAKFWMLHDGYWMGLGIGAGAVAGAARELWNTGLLKWSPPKGTGWDWWDLAWTVAGAVVPIVMLSWGWA